VDLRLEINHESDHDVFFGAEVVVDGPFVNIRRGSDFVDGDGLNISFAKQSDSGSDDLGATGGLRTLPTAASL
jgi:hypothetical protein